MASAIQSPIITAAAECLHELVRDIEPGAFENEQEEEIESMQAASEIKTSKRAKLDICEASLKTASAQVVVSNTLNEYARSVELHCSDNMY